MSDSFRLSHVYILSEYLRYESYDPFEKMADEADPQHIGAPVGAAADLPPQQDAAPAAVREPQAAAPAALAAEASAGGE